MDQRRFDAFARNLATAINRRTTIRAAITGALAAVAARAGDEADAAPEAAACRRIGSKCNRKKHKCCFGGRCSKKRCVCPRGEKQCRRTCIPQGDCCTDADCGANAQCLANGTCAPLLTCSADDCEGCCSNGVCSTGTTADACGVGGEACVACGANETCANGDCTCAAPFTTCGAACVNLQTDEGNCGACGTQCANNETCRDAQCVVLVTPGNLNGWVNDLPPATNTNYLPVTFVEGPVNPPLGSGSAKFAIDSSGSSRVSVRFPALASTRLADFAELTYSTYMENGSGTGVQVPALKLPTTTNITSVPFTTFIYEPTYSTGQGNVQQGVWQSWNAVAASARWWSSRDIPDPDTVGAFIMCNPNGSNANTTACAGKLFVPWSTVLQAVPNGALNEAGLQIETGSGAANAVGYTDALIVNGTTFDFDPDPQGAAGKSGKASRKNSGRNRKTGRRGKNRR